MKNNLRVLVVDDEFSLRQLMNFHLKIKGYSVLDAEDAESALNILEKENVDLIISDIRMPGDMDGIDLIVTHKKKNPGQKAILMTGYSLDERIAKAKSEGIPCLKKPFEISELENLLTEMRG